MLSPQEVTFFKTFGYLVAKGLFSQKEMDVIREESDSILDEDWGRTKFSGEGRQAVLGFVERRPFLSTLPSDERILDPLILQICSWFSGYFVARFKRFGCMVSQEFNLLTSVKVTYRTEKPYTI